MARKILFIAGIFVLLVLSGTSYAAENFFNGLPQEALDWLNYWASRPGDPYNPNTGHRDFNGTNIQFEMGYYEYEYYGETFYEGAFKVGISNKGWKTYTKQKDILKDLREATPAEQIAAASSDTYSGSVHNSVGQDHENKDPLVSSETPVASADKAGLRIIQNVVVPVSATKEQKEQKIAEKPKAIGGTFTYEDFEYYGLKGDSYEILSGLEKSTENFTLGFFVPINYVSIDAGNWTKLGTTGYIKKIYEKKEYDLSFGLNAYIENTWMRVSGVDDSFSYGIGPMASVLFRIKDVDLGFGTSYNYTANTQYESVGMVTSGANLGIPVGNNIVANLYTYRNDNLDSANDYWIIGGMASYVVSDFFAINLGWNTVTGLDQYDSNTYHLGANWKF
jgi:hypothetical protein